MKKVVLFIAIIVSSFILNAQSNNWGINLNVDYGQNIKQRTNYPTYSGGELNIFRTFPVSDNLFSLTAGMSLGINNYCSFWGMNLGAEKSFAVMENNLYVSINFMGGLELFGHAIINANAFNLKGVYMLNSTDRYQFGISLEISWYQMPTFDIKQNVINNEFNILKVGFEFRL